MNTICESLWKIQPVGMNGSQIYMKNKEGKKIRGIT